MLKNALATIMVTDLDAAVDYYTKTLGLKLNMKIPNAWAEVQAGDTRIGLHPSKEKQPISVGFDVSGTLEEEMEALKGRGAKFHGPIVDNPDEPIRLAFFTDADGNPMYLCENKER